MNATVQEIMTKIQEAASGADQDFRICRRCEVGTVLHQGDVYLVRVADDWPMGERLGTRQVAVGSSIGARHIVEGDDVEVYAGVKLPSFVEDNDQRLGPVVVSKAGFVLTHPEHAHHDVRQPGMYQVVYQLDMMTKRPVMD